MLRLYNTMGHKVEEFKPIHDGFVGFYGCGPTVYNYAHIGNLRAYVFLDTLDRTLTFLGYDKKHVMNITDVGHLTGDGDDGDDKMLKTATEKHQSVLEVAKFYTDAFLNDIDALNIIRPDVICKATEHIQDMIDLIKRIEANGHTYMAGGNLYFDVSTYPDYGKLANLNLDELKAGAGKRDIIVVDKNKKNSADFVLWFTKSKFENQALTWDSPWGRGYPGWHIECSAMSMKYLGEQFDIHTGGIDHVPVHHTNEIAQSEGATGKKWVNYWLHNEFLVIAKDKNKSNTEKMSKSSGNFLRLQSLIDKGYEPLDYRFFLLGGHYRKQIYFSWNAMESAKNSRMALVQKIAKLVQNANLESFLNTMEKTYEKGKASDIKGLSQNGSKYIEDFKSALENDLSLPVAMSILQKCVKDQSIDAKEALDLISRMDSVIGLKLIESAKIKLEKQKMQISLVDEHADDSDAPKINAMIQERQDAKKAKDFVRADQIRADLSAMGITIIDTPNGPTWKRN